MKLIVQVTKPVKSPKSWRFFALGHACCLEAIASSTKSLQKVFPGLALEGVYLSGSILT